VEFSLCGRISTGVQIAGLPLTIKVVFGVCLISLVVMDHLHHLQEIVLLQQNHRIGQLVKVDGTSSLALLVTALLAVDNLVTWDRAGFAEEGDQSLGWVAEGDDMLGLIFWLEEVEVVGDGVLAALLAGEEIDGHVKLSPTLVLAGEWRSVEGCKGIVSISLRYM
jgi:hypothetical protein